MNKKTLRIMMLSLFIGLFIVACEKELPTFQIPTDKQIEEFITEKKIVPLAVSISGTNKIILYQTESELGVYYVTTDRQGTLSNQQIKTSRNLAEPVSLIAGGGEKACAMVVINDDKLLQDADKITAIFSNNEVTVTHKGNKGYIIEATAGDARTNFEKIVIANRKGEVLFESK